MHTPHISAMHVGFLGERNRTWSGTPIRLQHTWRFTPEPKVPKRQGVVTLTSLYRRYSKFIVGRTLDPVLLTTLA